MIPREVSAAIEAFAWRVEREHRRDAWLAWHTAALSRAKRLPPLQRLLGGGETRVLQGEELELRRRERDEMLERIDVGKLNEAVRRRRGG